MIGKNEMGSSPIIDRIAEDYKNKQESKEVETKEPMLKEVVANHLIKMEQKVGLLNKDGLLPDDEARVLIQELYDYRISILDAIEKFPISSKMEALMEKYPEIKN